MSPARSGSKWLANYIDKATSAVGLHEWTLNHTRDGNEFPTDNRTTREFPLLLKQPQQITNRLKAAKAHHKLLKRDVVECNVYLEACTNELKNVFHDISVLHLKRDEKEIVRSILNRRWYASTEDQFHRTDSLKSWYLASQLERACRYVQSANNYIAAISDMDICYHKMTSDPDYLPEILLALKIVVHPLLADELFSVLINTNDHETVPRLCSWPESVFQTVETCFKLEHRDDLFRKMPAARAFAKTKSPPWKKLYVRGATAKKMLSGMSFSGSSNTRAVFTFFECQWESNLKGGIQIEEGVEYRICFTFNQLHELSARVFIVCFDQSGSSVTRNQLVNIEPNMSSVDFLYKPDASLSSFTVAILVDEQKEDWELTIKGLCVTQREQPEHYSVLPLFKECSSRPIIDFFDV
jgi:hypothetical protein